MAKMKELDYNSAPTLEYETKCRRCGEFETWYFSTVAQTTWLTFVTKAIPSIKDNPTQNYCEKCKKKTIQDIVSYTDFEPKFRAYYNDKTLDFTKLPNNEV